MTSRGYFGIGIILPKSECNVGGLFRSAQAFGASLVFTVGRRYQRQASDTGAATKHIPLFHYPDVDAMFGGLPKDCLLIAIEVTGALSLPSFSHPERAVYLLGPEDGSIPMVPLARAVATIRIPSDRCLNVATAGSIVMYDRVAKELAR